MNLRPRFIINTTTFICLAFIFRLVFVNASLLAASSNGQTDHFITSDFSHSPKKINRDLTEVSASNVNIYSDAAVCEEDLDGEEVLAKANTPAILSIFHCFFNPLTPSFKSIISFDSIKCGLQPKKYLALSILRV
mgnify:CR=1 FL=1